MPSFPIHWEKETDSPLKFGDNLPFESREIEKYLEDCHYHIRTNLPPTTFKVMPASPTWRDHLGRRFWAVQAINELGESWHVAAGSGLSPFNFAKSMSRWMLANKVDPEITSEIYLDQVIDEQDKHDSYVKSEAKKAEA